MAIHLLQTVPDVNLGGLLLRYNKGVCEVGGWAESRLLRTPVSLTQSGHLSHIPLGASTFSLPGGWLLAAIDSTFGAGVILLREKWARA